MFNISYCTAQSLDLGQFLFSGKYGICWRRHENPSLTIRTLFLSRSFRRATAEGSTWKAKLAGMQAFFLERFFTSSSSVRSSAGRDLFLFRSKTSVVLISRREDSLDVSNKLFTFSAKTRMSPPDFESISLSGMYVPFKIWLRSEKPIRYH